ncbi:aKG-HExxH-type peptide beta-hydroxylase [Methylorubrum extorquens]
MGLDRSFLEGIVVLHSEKAVGSFLDRYAADLDAGSTGLASLLQDWLADPKKSFECVWDPAFGGIYAELLKTCGSPVRRAAVLALRLHEHGYPGEWEAHFASSTSLRFGRWPLPAATAVRVSVASDIAVIRLGNDASEKKIEFARDNRGGWSTAGLRRLPATGGEDQAWTILSADPLDTWEFEGIVSQMHCGDPDLLRTGCDQAHGILEESGDAYYPWVKSVVRQLVPWKHRPGQYPSGSSSTNCAPGVIGIGNHSHALALADTLVHEASHQYFYIYGRLGPLEDGSDDVLYYNPFLEMSRPIDRILLAYHAFANILLFCRTLRERGYSDDPYVVDREQFLVPRIAVLEDALRRSTALTQQGNALWEALHDRVYH